MYSSGLIHSMDELDPDFQLEPGVGTFDDTVYWDNEKGSFNAETGKLMGVPINPRAPRKIAPCPARAEGIHGLAARFAAGARGGSAGLFRP
jgi:hypothetical protein